MVLQETRLMNHKHCYCRKICCDCGDEVKSKIHKDKRLQQLRLCQDCGAEVTLRSLRCRSCLGKLKSAAGVLPALRLLALDKNVRNRTDAAARLGVSRERVRQLCVKYNIPIPRYGSRKVSWQGPGCGKVRRTFPSNVVKQKSLYCISCSNKSRRLPDIWLTCAGCGKVYM